MAKAQAAKEAMNARFKEQAKPAAAKPAAVAKVVEKQPAAAEAPPSLFASAPKQGLFSWASNTVQVEAPKANNNMRFAAATSGLKVQAAPADESEAGQSTGATGVNDMVETVAGSFVLLNLHMEKANKMDTKTDKFIRRALAKVVGWQRESGMGMLEVAAVSVSRKVKPVAEMPVLKRNVSKNLTSAQALAKKVLGEVVDGDATELVETAEGNGTNATNATVEDPIAALPEKYVSADVIPKIRVNFALRGARAGNKAVDEIIDALRSLENATSSAIALFQKELNSPAAEVNLVVANKFNGESFDVCPSLCSNEGLCQGSGACRCNDGYGDVDCSNEICPGGCGANGKCNENKTKCDCDDGFAGKNCEVEACPKECSRHGTCDEASGKCACNDDWQGEACDVPLCPKNCSYHGACKSSPAGSTCLCDPEWTGDACATPACPTSEETPDKVCSGFGKCRSGKCTCRSGYTGEDCSEQKCPGDCFGHGECKNWACQCFSGWEGVSCNMMSCEAGCAKHGQCNNGTCVCKPGFVGKACERLDCPEDCNKHGLCINSEACVHHSDNCTTPHTCKCEQGWRGPTCGLKECPQNCAPVANGTANGRCNFTSGKCICHAAYYGAACELSRCPGKTGPRSGCSGHGTCDGKGSCTCQPGWIHGLRKDCNWRGCPGGCNGNGACLNGTCTCQDGFTGATCDVAICPGKPECSGQGICNRTDGKCACKQGFTGRDCGLEACPMNCHNRGVCDAVGKCNCHAGYTGDDCGTRFVVHGEILKDGSVKCFHGYGGPDCNVKECRNNCSSRGICVEGVCYCKPSWTGEHCQHAACPNECYYHGKCVKGNCKCDDGYKGVDCSRRHVENGICHVATGECECSAVKQPAFKGQMWTGADCASRTCSKNCTGRGECTKQGVCECMPDWLGISCEKPACPYACHGNGHCNNGVCKCDDMWAGEACEQRAYWCPKDCSNHGKCEKSANGSHSCTCDLLPKTKPAALQGSKSKTAMFEGQHWAGEACEKLSCPLGHNNGLECSGKGVCVGGKCECEEMFGGSSCQLSVCKDSCNYNGKCIRVNGDAVCKCEDGFTGASCAEKACHGHGICSDNGVCNEETKVCECHDGYTGKGCNTPTCPKNCTGHGQCTKNGCACVAGWTGSFCSIRTCPNNCNGVGKCIDGACACDEFHKGVACAERKCKNDCNKRGVCNTTTFMCNCAPGWKGEGCDRSTCGHGCGEHGHCSVDDSGLSAHCECAAGYAGGLCEHTCKNRCNGHGRCGTDADGQPKCVKCDAGYGGLYCEKRCPNGCSGKGKCMITGKCGCVTGWTGASCNVKACPEQCSGHGLCQNSGTCKCEAGYAGDACNVKYWRCEKNCNNHGACIRGGNNTYTCKCDSKWGGKLCDEERCDPGCHNGGVCKNQTCMCKKGFTGRTCSMRVCPKNCMAHGRCLASGTCKCDPGYKGPGCSIRYVVHGKCSMATRKCTCDKVQVNASFPGQMWTGPACVAKTCAGNCTGRGVCGEDGVCACKGLWMGRDCSVPVCKNQCSGHGRCIGGACKCAEGYSGEDCSTFNLTFACPKGCSGKGQCDTKTKKCKCDQGYEGVACQWIKCAKKCSKHGRCAHGLDGKPICVCNDGFTGVDCATTCPGGPTCSNHGDCHADAGVAKCVCESGFAGKACSKMCPSQCNGRGACYLNPAGGAECACRNGWTGWECEKSPCPKGCSDNGKCVNGSCVCDAEWSGDDCATKRCPRDCSGKGACSGTPAFKCTCQAGFSGDDCSEKVQCINDCSHHGECTLVNKEKTIVAKCVCDYGYGGLDCSAKVCLKDVTGRQCSGQGDCVNGVCKCKASFSGELCSVHDCKSSNGKPCSGNGFCDEKGSCTCDEGWIDAACSTKVCPVGKNKDGKDKPCSGRGVCSESVCTCEEDYFGSACELGGTTPATAPKVAAKVDVPASQVNKDVKELKRMAAKAGSDPMEQASIEKLIKEKETEEKEETATGSVGTSTGATGSAEEDQAVQESVEKERKEEKAVKELQAEVEAAKPNPTLQAKLEQRLNQEKLGLEQAKVDEQVAVEDKASKDAENAADALVPKKKRNATSVKPAPASLNRTKAGCGKCFNGDCVESVCVCKQGWEGADCSKQTCGRGCKHGQCVQGTCQCDVDEESGLPAYFGETCDLRQCVGSVDQKTGNFNSCSGHGQCMSVGDKVTEAVCDCEDGWGKDDCSVDLTKGASSILECNNGCVSKCQKSAAGNSDSYLNCFAKCSAKCGGHRSNIPFELKKTMVAKAKLNASVVAKPAVLEEVSDDAVEKAISASADALKGEKESMITPHSLVKGIVNAKNAFDHFMGEQKRDDSPIGKHIDSLERCDLCMKDTFSKIVANKARSDTLANFLTNLCEKASGKKCNMVAEALKGHTEANGRTKAVRLFCMKVHKVCKSNE